MNHENCGGELLDINPLDDGRWSGQKTYICGKCSDTVSFSVEKKKEIEPQDCPSGSCSL